MTPEALDTLYTCLASHRRRRLIEGVAASSGPVPYEALVQFISDGEHGGRTETESAEIEVGVRMALIHNHLPKLDSADVLDVDYDERTVQPGARFDQALSLLDRG